MRSGDSAQPGSSGIRDANGQPLNRPNGAPAPNPNGAPNANGAPAPKPAGAPNPNGATAPNPNGPPGANGAAAPNGVVIGPPPPAGSTIAPADARRRNAAEEIGQRIVEIKIVDNSKTDAVTIEYIADVRVGQPLSAELVDGAKVRLLSSGLFKDVNIYWEGGVVDKENFHGVRLIISAKDKLSWIIAPIFAASSSNYGGGLAYAESNAFGKNKKFLVLADYTTAEKMLFAAYLDPQIRDTRWYWRADLLLRRDTIVEYAANHDDNPRLSRATDVDTFGAGLLAGINITRRFHLDLRLKIYYDRVNPSSCYNTTNSDGSGTPDVVASQGGHCRQPSSSGWDNTLTANIGYDGRSKVYGVLHGFMINFTYQYGASWLGTRFDYHLLSGNGMYAWRFFKEHNLLLKVGADVFFDPPFKQELEVGGEPTSGGITARGFIYRQYRGDTDVRATLEYLLPLFTVYGLSFRLIAFYDTNLTWFRSIPSQGDGPLARFVVRGSGFRDFLPDTPSGVVRDSWHNGIGGGLRLYLKGIILPLVGVDFAYGFESRAFQWYISLGSTLD
jgi:outer membrane protein assembly factor BamA